MKRYVTVDVCLDCKERTKFQHEARCLNCTVDVVICAARRFGQVTPESIRAAAQLMKKEK